MLKNDFLFQFGEVLVFKRMLDEGFVHFKCGCARQYHKGKRVAVIFSFLKPPDAPQQFDFPQITTWQVVKTRCDNGFTATWRSSEVRYSEAAFSEFLRMQGIVLGEDVVCLADVALAMERQMFEEEGLVLVQLS